MQSNIELNKGLSNWNSLSVLPTNTQYAAGGLGERINLQSGMGFIPVNGEGEITYVDLSNTKRLSEALYKCAPLAAVINNLADSFVSGKFEVLNRSTQNYVRGQYKAWERLLARPNPMQSRKHFFKQLYFNVLAYGWCFGLKYYPSGMKDMPYEMWILPSESLQFEKKSWRGLPSEYKNLGELYNIYFTANGERTLLDWDDLMYFTDSTMTNPYTMMPTSRMIPLRYPISNAIAIYEAQATLVQKRGAIGILSNHARDQMGHIPVEAPERERVERQFYSNYGLTRGQSQVIITTAALQWQQMAMNVKDLMLFEGMESCLKDICDAYGYPLPLSAHSDQSTYNNVATADRLLYQNTIIPASEDLIDEQFNEQLKTFDSNIEIVMNFEALPALQATKKEKSEADKLKAESLQVMWDLGLVTRNGMRESFELDTIPDPEFDKFKFELEQENTPTNEPAKPKN